MGDHVHTDVFKDLGTGTEKTAKRRVLEEYFKGGTRTGWAAIGTLP